MTGILKVKGEKIFDAEGNEVVLRGTAIGGWMNMENFITGYPGHEHTHRAAMEEVLGKEKADYFFDRFLEYFVGEADIKCFAELGLNCIRLPFNYRHFEDDMNPRVLKEEGFKHLDRVIDLCAKHKIYTILDMHAVPGGQNNDWHSDNPTNAALFWEYEDFQSRSVWLWEEIAKRYKGNEWVAGYNPLNEPADPKGTRLVTWMARVEKAIRKIDPDHILYWDGNTFAADFSLFGPPLPNSVYACHDYSMFGFPMGRTFTGSEDDIAKIKRDFKRKIDYMRENKVPIWNGEFGPVYANERQDGADFKAINSARYQALSAQLDLYQKENISWTIWLWKDIGIMGMTHASEESPWMKLISPWLDHKKKNAYDFWGGDDTDVKAIFDPLEKWVLEQAPEVEGVYPKTWKTKQHLMRVVRHTLISDALAVRFAKHFEGCSFEDLDKLAASFKFENCVQRDELNAMLKAHSRG